MNLPSLSPPPACIFWNFLILNMGEAEEVQLRIMTQEDKEASSPAYSNFNKSTSPQLINYMWWLRMVIYTLFVLSGQAAATLFGRLYYERGGKSIWMATFAQLAGFPLLFLCYCISPPRNPSPTINSIHSEQPSSIILALAYISFGIFLAADSMMFTPFIINSLVILTISSSLVIFQVNSSNSIKISKENYAIGFICTFGASAGYGLMLSLTQLSFKKVLKREAYTMVLEIIIYQSLVATCAALVGLFMSGEWKGIKKEMQEFELGKLSYVMTMVETAIASQIFTLGAVGLIFEGSSLFSNVVSVLGLPIVPILAMIYFSMIK
ncbi:hypothetical protein JRO89_XS06G0022300 [Xanthoceras sorbifolium]|uniref:Probable purine permease n=1 Tax=Xanthoceras sorbifolium TaxID=99658 RepID=A0ABQ8HWG6_9ROSI|nr:hypothetical protein JRO89_XS06G0022300 [Xanthoceras sorbifolium]